MIGLKGRHSLGVVAPFARRFGLPFRVFGQLYTFSDDTRTVAAVATLEELEGMKKHSAGKYAWYQYVE